MTSLCSGISYAHIFVLSVSWEHCFWLGFVDGCQDKNVLCNIRLPIFDPPVYLVGFYLCFRPDSENCVLRLKNFIRCIHSKYLIRISFNADQSKLLKVCHIYYMHQKAIRSLISFINGFWRFLFTHQPYEELCAWWTAQ